MYTQKPSIRNPGGKHNNNIDQGGRFKNIYELLNPRALKISMLYKNRIFQCMAKIFWNSTQNILSIHWKMCILFTGKNLRALRFKSS